MTATSASTTPTACPAWCSDHSTDEHGQQLEHRAHVEVGPIALEVAQLVTPAEHENRAPVVVLPDVLTVSSHEARAYAAALTAAAALVEGHEVDELVCSRCAPHAADSFDAGVRAGRRLGAQQ